MKRCGAVLIVVVVLLTLSGMVPTIAQDSLNVTKVGSLYNYWDQTIGVEVSGSYAYVADCRSGLRVLDISIPANPVEVGYYDTPGRANDVVVPAATLMWLTIKRVFV